MTDEQKTPELPEGFEIVTAEYRLANEYPSGDVMFFAPQSNIGWRKSIAYCGWSDEYMDNYVFAIKVESPPDIPTQVGAIAERCARISKTTEHDVFAELAPHLEDWYLCVRVYIGGWCASPDVLKYKSGNFTKDEHLAADANRWLDKVLAEAGAVE